MKRMRKPNIDAHLTVMLKDKNGKVVYRRRYRSRSFVVGFLNALNYDFQGNGAAGSPAIVVGSGKTPPSITDAGLTSQIGNGTGAGQLQYGNNSIVAPVINSNTNSASFTWSRSFSNNSGGNVTVSEVGASISVGSNGYFILHDLLPSPVTVGNGQVLTVVYTITITV